MGEVNTNDTTFTYSVEDSAGDPSSTWRTIVLTNPTSFGAQLTTAESRPISKNRGRNKGAVVDLDSTVGFEADLTLQHLHDFAPRFLRANWRGAYQFDAVSVSATQYTVVSQSVTLPTNSLVRGKGFVNSENNIVGVVTAATATTITVSGLAAEASAPTNAVVEYAGHRGAVGDIGMNASGHLTSSSLDFTTLPLVVGMWIVTGGDAAGNRFATEANNGRHRIRSISANLLELEFHENTPVADAGAGQQIDIWIPRHGAQVPVDDADYLSEAVQVEFAAPGLGPSDEEMYLYSLGNNANTMTFSFQGQSLATATMEFIGKDTENPTTTRKTGAATPIEALQTAVFNTSSDFVRLRVQDLDETGSFTAFKDVEFTLTNNVSPRKCLGVLGAAGTNIGIMTIDGSGSVTFDSQEIITWIRDNESLSMDFALRNDDGGFILDMPSLTLGGGDLDLPADETVTASVELAGYNHPTLNTSLIIDVFSYYPSGT